jgi:endoplasmic reticulum-Golgi intermediate compartment protein 1
MIFILFVYLGNFHVSTHSADRQPDSVDMAHYITSLTFGAKLEHKNLPGNFNPLARRDRSAVDAAESHDYTMKIVPTIYEESSGNTEVSYQYTYAYTV